MVKKPKKLTEDDVQVWRHVTSRVERSLPDRAMPVEIAKKKHKVAKQIASVPIQPFSVGSKAIEKKVTQPPAFSVRPSKTSSNMDKKNFQRLLKGKLEIDATLDLHGMTADQAKVYLQSYLVHAHKSGHRMILVITGKGKHKGTDEFNRPKGGILRQSLRDWLTGPMLASKVLQVSQAQPKHGGAGAFYVYLRRIREA